ncbi:MAG: hypothetical protein M3Q65_18510 [Chloroflexota bacterium]|nr:hypothetical protein [Chloroflexota bacterium]
MDNVPIYDGEHCPICGGDSHLCGHAMTGEELLEEFADGLPSAVIRRLARIETEEELAAVSAGPDRLRQIVDGKPLEELPDLTDDYWAEDPGVVQAFFEGDRPGGSGMGYWHTDPVAFEVSVRDEAAALLRWLDEHLPDSDRPV